MEGPLTELRNQRLPRRKMAQTYGKKKTTGSGTAHKDLFGSDDRELETGLANLNLDPQPPKSQKLSPSAYQKRERSSSIARTPIQPALEEHELVSNVKFLDHISMYQRQKISQEDSAAIKPLLSLSEGNVDLFTSFGTKLAKSFNVEKIGEGSFAEVFKVISKSNATTSRSQLQSQSQSQLQPSSTKMPAGNAIIKIIPLKLPSSDPTIHERLSTVDSVAREIRVLRTLDSIHGFTRFRGVLLVCGLWPRIFLDAFRAFRRAHRKRAINGAPDDDFDANQIYAVVEMDDAGSEIYLIKRPSVFQVYDIFWMSVILLANAEEHIEFEHRDLHLSNVCVKPYITVSEQTESEATVASEEYNPPQPQLDIDPSLLTSMTESDIPSMRLGLSNLKLTIIDYTVARCCLNPPSSSSTTITTTTTSPPEIAYDPMTFVSTIPNTGNSFEESLQFATYRKCHAAVTLAQRQSKLTDEKWKQFVPRTNVVWLAYLLQALSARAKGRVKKYHIVKGSSKVAKRVQEEMWDVLGLVEDVVCGVDVGAEGSDEEEDEEEFEEVVARVPASAMELLERAVEEGWLSRGEVEVFTRRLEREE